MKTSFLLFIFSFFFFLSSFAQTKFTKNQKVEVEWKGKWYKATVLEVNNNSYKIHYEGYASSWDETVNPSRIRTIGATAANSTTAKNSAMVKYGKYGCTASKYSGGSYQYIPKGSFVLSPNGTYSYNGFEKPSSGKFRVDAKGVIAFTGGYLDKGEATPMEGQESRYYLVFPTIPDGRWTCKWVE